MYDFSVPYVILCGLVLSFLQLDPKFTGSNPEEGYAILRAIKSAARLPSEGM
jgi:hypothetical protein